MQNEWGVEHTVYGRSFSQALLESLNAWGLLEGTHLLMLMLFFGTILMVDLRLLGVAFKEQPVSVISNKILKLTVFSMVVVMVTGVVLFFSKPEEYWHNIWFRTKLVLLAVAIINVAVFHKLVQKNQAEWDSAPKPPSKARISAIISIASWVAVIGCGRLIAYNWFECGKPQPAWVNSAQGCAISSKGAMDMDAVTGTAAGVDLPPETPAETPPAEAPAAEAPATQPEAK